MGERILQIPGGAAALLAAVLIAAAPGASAAERELVASLAQIPALIESADEGAFVDLLKAIDDAYPGAIARRMFPFARSIDNVVKGAADLHIPMLHNPKLDLAELPYRFASERLGVVEIVLYSHVKHPITREMIEASLQRGGAFPYNVETLRGTAELGDFPMGFANSVDQGLMRVAAGRSDAFFMAQDEADSVLRELRLKDVHRVHYAGFDDVIVISKGPAGEEVDRILSGAIRELKASGRWDPIYQKVHRPYEDWQPAQQGW